MKKILGMTAFFLLNACTTEYILMDEKANPVESGYYTENTEGTSGVENMELAEYITANDVFVVGEGADFVTYQYKNVRVDEISPLASMYCADIAYGGSPYLREVSMYHNGFMRATFDCVSLAI